MTTHLLFKAYYLMMTSFAASKWPVLIAVHSSLPFHGRIVVERLVLYGVCVSRPQQAMIDLSALFQDRALRGQGQVSPSSG